MKHKRIIYGASSITLLLLLMVWLARRGSGDVSRVCIGFAGYEVVDGKRSLILIVTNGSSYRISRPGDNYTVRGESADGMSVSDFRFTSSCGALRCGWWQLQLPKIPSVAPGATFRLLVPVADGPYTWHVTVPFRTIPFTDRLPYALRSRWPSSKRETPISFEVTSPPIPPTLPSRASEQHSSTASVVDSRRTPQ
jgi:hypothetical protein